MHRVSSRQSGMNRISSTASLKGCEGERPAGAEAVQPGSSGGSWLPQWCWPQHMRSQRGSVLTIAMCLLLVCAAFMGVFGYGFGLGRLADRCRLAPFASPVCTHGLIPWAMLPLCSCNYFAHGKHLTIALLACLSTLCYCGSRVMVVMHGTCTSSML